MKLMGANTIINIIIIMIILQSVKNEEIVSNLLSKTSSIIEQTFTAEKEQSSEIQIVYQVYSAQQSSDRMYGMSLH